MITLSDLKRLIAPLQRKIYLLVGRAALKAINNAETTQKIQITGLSGETITDIERFQEYGFETYPLKDAEVLPIFLNGNRDNGIILCVHDRRYRLTDLISGETAQYTHEDQNSGNHRVHLKTGQIVEEKGLVLNHLGVNEINEVTIDKTETVSNDTVETIGNDKIETIGNHKKETITGDKLNTITGNKTNAVTGNKIETAASITGTASTTYTIGGVTVIIGATTLTITGTNISITDASGITVSVGNIKATTGDIEDQKGTMEEMRTVFNSHTHNENDNAPNPTQGPNTQMT